MVERSETTPSKNCSFENADIVHVAGPEPGLPSFKSMKAILSVFLVGTLVSPFCLAGKMPGSFIGELNEDGEKTGLRISSTCVKPGSLDLDLSAPQKINGVISPGGFPARPTKRMGRYHITREIDHLRFL